MNSALRGTLNDLGCLSQSDTAVSGLLRRREPRFQRRCLPARPGWRGPLLNDVSQLVRQERLAFAAARLVRSLLEEDGLPSGEGARVDRTVEGVGLAVGVNADAAEIRVKGLLERRPYRIG